MDNYVEFARLMLELDETGIWPSSPYRLINEITKDLDGIEKMERMAIAKNRTHVYALRELIRRENGKDHEDGKDHSEG